MEQSLCHNRLNSRESLSADTSLHKHYLLIRQSTQFFWVPLSLIHHPGIDHGKEVHAKKHLQRKKERKKVKLDRQVQLAMDQLLKERISSGHLTYVWFGGMVWGYEREEFRHTYLAQNEVPLNARIMEPYEAINLVFDMFFCNNQLFYKYRFPCCLMSSLLVASSGSEQA